ncbi:hypothetical protein LAZ67_8001195 [Cordylochernes scorpioides]|uniref:Reverse transcriptase Ty1/copia-type domain-containing protein n=1 Tax=Cordylochernes scorpioides TaxID=51811 RepID=A0ABY6KQT1_9ARAC|nr:hypothetical protein LAZ67_8001195 [Cordylochernes scorpioides]
MSSQATPGDTSVNETEEASCSMTEKITEDTTDTGSEAGSDISGISQSDEYFVDGDGTREKLREVILRISKRTGGKRSDKTRKELMEFPDLEQKLENYLKFLKVKPSKELISEKENSFSQLKKKISTIINECKQISNYQSVPLKKQHQQLMEGEFNPSSQLPPTGNCEEIVAEDFLILKEDNPVTESKMKSQEDTSVKLGGDCENDSSQTEPIQERCVKGGRKKGETKSILEERHKARLEEQERKLIEEGVRRSQRIKDRNNANLIMEIDHYIPENFKEAMDSGERNEWHKAMEDELSEIEKHKVWTLVPRENGMKVINSKWVYSTKKTPSDGIYKRKARLVAVGCNQRYGVDYKESFSPVLKKESLRTIVALATQHNLTIKTYDVKTAYLYGKCWNKKINEILYQLGMIRTKCDPCVYKLQRGEEYAILGLYVDDLIIAGTSKEINDNLASEIEKYVTLTEKKDSEPFIGIEIKREEDGFYLSQTHYIDTILHRFGLEECNSVQTPGDQNQNLDEYLDSKPVDKTVYQEMIGSLMYLSMGTRPDISFNVSNLSQYKQPLASQSSEPLSSKKETSIIPKIKPPPYYRRKRQLPAERTSWDEPIESDIKSNWNKFQTQLSCLKEIKIPRYLNSSSSEIEELQLHGFCDASLNAYSAVFYLKTRFKNQKIKINLITSKTKVAPLKTITIPRLELSAALLLAQMNQVILESFPFQPDKTFLWTDSQICIDWIRSDASRWKAFVSNRVSSIQNLTQITDWFHVSSQDNPADCASRGIMPQDLVNHRIWWRGPIWLQENNVRYIPSSPTQVNLNIIQEEVGEGQVLDQTTLIQNSETMLNLEFIERYSTITKLIQITAWCWRFYYNCLLFDPIRQKGPLTTRELTKAIQVLVKSIQQVEFCTEIKLLKSNKQLPLSNKLTSLNPFLKTQGLLRVGGRLKYSYLNENQNFPLLQPKTPRQESLIKNLLTENADIPEAIDENQEDSSILETTFVIEDEEFNKDIGTPKIEISEVSVIDKSEGKYSKEPVVSVEALDKKELCHDDPAHLNVVEGDLNRPKEATSGIINISTEANESSSKEKVVPVEIGDTSTMDYLQSGEKAKLSRWKPIDSLCLEDVKESEDDDENYSSSAYIEWPEILKKEVLIPEALEKAVNLEDFEKAAESRQLSKEHLEESTEQGSCIKAESKTWEDPIESDLAAAESDNPALPERELANESENLIQDSPQSDTQRWKLIKKLKNSFWSRWPKEYLSNLQGRGKWRIKQDNIQIGQLVYLKEAQISPLHWPLARIQEIFPGEDKNVRVVQIKTSKGVFKRPIIKLIPLPLNNENCNLSYIVGIN